MYSRRSNNKSSENLVCLLGDYINQITYEHEALLVLREKSYTSKVTNFESVQVSYFHPQLKLRQFGNTRISSGHGEREADCNMTLVLTGLGKVKGRLGRTKQGKSIVSFKVRITCF